MTDTGDFEAVSGEMTRVVLQAAEAADRPVALIVDEVQYLGPEELASVVVACHDAARRALPFTLFGAGLSQVARLAGDAKSYAERLFEFPEAGSLTDGEASIALLRPANEEGVQFDNCSIQRILTESRNNPILLLEWGSHVWRAAGSSPIPESDVTRCKADLIGHLACKFFRVRFGRCKPLQQDQLLVMVELDPGSHSTGGIAAMPVCESNQVAATRAQLSSLGMLYSQRREESAFAVPMYDDFMKRQMPMLDVHLPKERSRTVIQQERLAVHGSTVSKGAAWNGAKSFDARIIPLAAAPMCSPNRDRRSRRPRMA